MRYRITPAGQLAIKKAEGLRLTRYNDPGRGVQTIGYGHTKTAQQYNTITQATAEKLFAADIADVENYINNWAAAHSLFLWPAQVDALGSFVFNLGSIPEKITKRFIDLQGATVASQMLKYRTAAGEVLPGLVTRRMKEAQKFNQPKTLFGLGLIAAFVYLCTSNR